MMDRPKPTPPCTLTEMLSEIDMGSDSIYWGPGAHTVTELEAQSPFGLDTVKSKAEEQVRAGEWVRVTVQRVSSSRKAYYPTAYVRKDVYDDWVMRRGKTDKLTTGASNG